MNEFTKQDLSNGKLNAAKELNSLVSGQNEFPDTGKIHDEFFKSFIYPFCGSKRSEVVVPPQFGVDVALVRMPNGYDMALTSDPLSLIPTLGLRESAWLSVHLMANDMATTGKAPMFAQFVLNLPPTLSAGDFETYWKYIHQYCAEMGTAITGGHTGRFEGQESTVAGGGTMIAIAPSGEMLTSTGASVGDAIIVTKEPAIIATAILALSFPDTVRNNCGTEIQQRAAELINESSALKTGLAAGTLNTSNDKIVTAMHDVTEGGVLGAIYEMAMAAGCGVLIEKEKLPSGEAQEAVCNLFNVDPNFCIGAGSMIIAAKNEKAAAVVEALKTAGIKAAVVGRLTSNDEGLKIDSQQGEKPLQHPGTDPYWKAFYAAFAKGLK